MTELSQNSSATASNREDDLHDGDPAGKTLGLKAIASLIWRTWPYIKPQLIHVIAFVCINGLGTLLFMGPMFLASDVFNNKILVGQPLQSMQATVLMLDDSYVTTGVKEEPKLSPEQRNLVLDRLLIMFGVVTLILLSLTAITPYYAVWVYQRINQQLRSTMLERAEHLSLKYHSQARTGDLIYRIYQDSAMITNVIQSLIISPLRIMSTILFAVFVLAFFSPWLLLMFVLTAIPVTWLIVWFTPRLQFRARKARESNSDLTSSIQEVFSAIKMIKANRSEASILARFNGASNEALDAAFYYRRELVGLSLSVIVIAMTMVFATEYLMASWTLLEESTYLGAVVAWVGFATWNLGAYQSATGRVTEATNTTFEFIRLWGAAQDLLVGLDRAFFLLDLHPEVEEAEHPLAFPEHLRAVSIRHARFSYRTGSPVLHDLNLSAEKGTITAVVGATGAGKSTLMSLLLRLYDPDEGAVCINEINLRDIRISSLKENIAIALQQNVLFAMTIAENIGYANPSASPQAIKSAATVACADRFIEQMAQGYATELGERGSKLSTGQRQRISIARAIVRDTPILILDEPTASLDAETEHQVLRNLAAWGRERIVFLVTHRLSTIRNADQIAFLENGKVVEVGSHDTLMAIPNGRYRGFVRAETDAADAAVRDPGSTGNSA